MTGILFGGIAIGPAISSILIQMTGNVLVPFYVMLSIHTIQSLYLWFIMPESLSKTKQLEARQLQKKRKDAKHAQARQDAWELEREGYGRAKSIWMRVKILVSPITAIFAPVALLGPRRTSNGFLDWSLPMVALSGAFYSMLMVS